MLAPLTNLNDLMTSITPFAALIIGLLSLPHCAGMCGPISMTVTEGKGEVVLFQIGRFFGYSFFVLTGSLIGKVFLQQFSNDIQRLAGISVALTFMIMGWGVLRKRKTSFNSGKSFIGKVHKALIKSSKGHLGGTFVLGTFSVFLPCGLLYSVILGVIALENFALSFLCIFMFWLGTLPATFFAPQIINKIISPLTSRRPKLIGILLIVIGFVSLYSRLDKKVEFVGNTEEHKVDCH